MYLVSVPSQISTEIGAEKWIFYKHIKCLIYLEYEENDDYNDPGEHINKKVLTLAGNIKVIDQTILVNEKSE